MPPESAAHNYMQGRRVRRPVNPRRHPDEGTRGRRPNTRAAARALDQMATAGVAGRNDLLEMQRFLRNQGYAIPVDGRWGPLTKSAYNDWHRGKGQRSPQAWTSRLRRQHDGNMDASGVSRNNQRNQPAHSSSNNLRPENRPVPSKPAGRMGSGMDGLLSNEDLDVDVLANAMVESEYGPILAELQREESRIRQTGPERLSQIDRIYNDLSGSLRTRNAAGTELSTRLLRGQQGAASSMASALGLEAADPSVLATVGANASIESDFLRDISAADERFGNDLLASAEIERASARSNALAEDKEVLDELSSKRTELTSGRASDLINARMKAMEFVEGIRSNRQKEALAMFNAKLAASMAPLEQQKALNDLMSQTLDMDLTRAQIGATNRSNRPKAKPGVRRNFGQLDPAELTSLQNSILDALPEGVKQKRAIQIINSRLRSAGYKPRANRRVGRFAYDTARAAGLVGVSPSWWGLSGR